MRVRAIAAAATAIALSAFSPAASALAAHDVTAPVISTNVYASFVVGSVISAADYRVSNDLEAQTTKVDQRMTYAINDDSGRICGINIFRLTYEGQSYPPNDNYLVYDDLVIHSTPFRASITLQNDDYFGQLGDTEDSTVGWLIYATDCYGNGSAVRVYSKPVVVQQDGYDWSGSSTGTVASTGTWRTVSCACASGRTMAMTTARSASISYTDTYDEDGEHMAVVMARGPARGSAAIFVDGVRVKTVNTWAAANGNRVVVFQRAMPAGRHVVKVVNLATNGHARIDVDAFMTN